MKPILSQIIILGGLILVVLAVIVLAVLSVEPAWLPLSESAAEEEAVITLATPTPVPTFTSTPSPSPLPTFTPTLTPTTTPTPVPSPTFTPNSLTNPTNPPTATQPPPPTSPPAPVEPPTPTRPAVDFVVVKQRMRTNEENSVLGKVANNCGGDHTIYVTVVDGAGQPLTGVIVGDTYKNVRAASGSGGLGQLRIDLWSNTMSLEVQGHIDGTPYTSEQTLPLSTRDEDIPAEWLFAGGYCGSIEDCQLRQKTNGLCRGHYSYDVTFQRTW
ncbi:MAG: hypothetical protein HS114_02460 [Anaerolineales bacterium]|nr:hypothetical protein [Anaerolineales bacterium]